MKWMSMDRSLAVVAMLATSVYAQQTPCTGDLGCWRHNSDTLAQSATIKQNADGSVAIGIAITGGSAGSAPQGGSPASRVIEAPRGGSSQGGTDLFVVAVECSSHAVKRWGKSNRSRSDLTGDVSRWNQHTIGRVRNRGLDTGYARDIWKNDHLCTSWTGPPHRPMGTRHKR